MKYNVFDFISLSTGHQAIVLDCLEEYGVQYLYLGFYEGEFKGIDTELTYEYYKEDGRELVKLSGAERDEFAVKFAERPEVFTADKLAEYLEGLADQVDSMWDNFQLADDNNS